ncbi:MAG: HlyD family type I secretion periplasmic adaptor subunit [Gammaproteobacteria bacterium]|nr:HlyD family type I secretion periplasmic adaptor subunit [Gammaproteobacteria bacterium]
MAMPRRIGLTLLFLIFGIFGSWAALAPLDGAAHAPGIVTVKSYKKLIQHLEGGIVSEIAARDGDFVRAGEPILILDATQSQAQLDIANAQLVALAATESRLISERDSLSEVIYPDFLMSAELNATEEMNAQNQIFRAHRAAQEGSIEVLEQRIEQLQSRSVGLEALKTSREELAASYAEEIEDTRALLSQGFSDKTRLRELERNYATYSGEAAELVANISSTGIEVGETRLQILQLDKELQNDVAESLGETQTSLKDIRERITALQDVVRRTVIRAPEDGVLSGMQAHTVGGVIGAGLPIADLVPQSDELIIEANVSPVDIDRIAIGQEATIRFSAFGRSTVPTIFGKLIGISADRIVDEMTGAPYYLARIEVSPEGLEDLGDLVLVPGMPAEAFINTGSRTFLQYMLNPLTNSMARSFRED